MNQTEKATPRAALRYAFNTYTGHLRPLWGASIFTTIATNKLISLYKTSAYEPYSYLGALFYFSIGVCAIFLFLAEIQVILDVYFTEESSKERFWYSIRYVPAFVASMAIALVPFAPLLWGYFIGFSLILPIINLSTIPLYILSHLSKIIVISFIVSRLVLIPFIVVDTNPGVIETIKLSYYNTKGYVLTMIALFLFWGILGWGIARYFVLPVGEFIFYYYPSPNLIPVLACITTIIVRPVVFLSLVYVYGHKERQKVLQTALG